MWYNEIIYKIDRKKKSVRKTIRIINTALLVQLFYFVNNYRDIHLTNTITK